MKIKCLVILFVLLFGFKLQGQGISVGVGLPYTYLGGYGKSQLNVFGRAELGIYATELMNPLRVYFGAGIGTQNYKSYGERTTSNVLSFDLALNAYALI
jgi:hypothetical protein